MVRVNKAGLSIAAPRGAARIFIRGRAEIMETKSFQKETLLAITIAKESTYFMDEQLTVLTTKIGVFPTKLPSYLFDVLSEYKSVQINVSLHHTDLTKRPRSFATC